MAKNESALYIKHRYQTTLGRIPSRGLWCLAALLLIASLGNSGRVVGQEEVAPALSLKLVSRADDSVFITGTLTGDNGRPLGGKWIRFFLVSEFFGQTHQVLLGRGFTDYSSGEGKLPYQATFDGPHHIRAEYEEQGSLIASSSAIFELGKAPQDRGENTFGLLELRAWVGIGALLITLIVWATMLGVMVWVRSSIRHSHKHVTPKST